MAYPDNTPLDAWMGNLPASVRQRKSISELALPYCHNAGACRVKAVSEYALQDQMGKTIASLPSFLVGAFVKPIACVSALCQSQSIAELLRMGVRGLDFRVGLHDGEIHICHTVVCDLTLSSALQQVSEFLQEHPDEVVVVLIKRDWHHRDFDTTENWAMLQATVQSVLGDLVLRSQKELCTPIGELCARGKRAAVIMKTPGGVEVQSGIRMDHCVESSWSDDTSSVAAMIAMLQKWRENGWIKAERGKLTIMEVALPGAPRFVAPKAMKAFRDFLQDTTKFDVGANLDFPDTDTVKAIIQHNWRED